LCGQARYAVDSWWGARGEPFQGTARHHPHCGHLLLRDRGWLWMACVVSTLPVDSPVDASWKAWIADHRYPQPSTFIGNDIPHLPRTHPQRERCRDSRSTLAIPEFKRHIVQCASASHTYPHYPPPLLL